MLVLLPNRNDDMFHTFIQIPIKIDEDAEFASPVESEGDEVDSDFDIEEKDEPLSDEENDGEGTKVIGKYSPSGDFASCLNDSLFIYR